MVQDFPLTLSFINVAGISINIKDRQKKQENNLSGKQDKRKGVQEEVIQEQEERERREEEAGNLRGCGREILVMSVAEMAGGTREEAEGPWQYLYCFIQSSLLIQTITAKSTKSRPTQI